MGLRPGLVWIISLILCTPSVPSSTGMWERVWRRESSPRPVSISLPWRRITRRSELTPSREKERRGERNIKLLTLNPKTLNQLLTESGLLACKVFCYLTYHCCLLYVTSLISIC